MRRALVVLSVVVALLLPASAPAPAGADPGGDEARLLQLLNVSRAAAGLNLLTLDPGLSAIARGWAGRMAAVGDISHNRSLAAQLSGFAWTRAAENVASADNVDDANGVLWNSPPHRAHILGDFQRVGVGVAWAGSRLYATFNFLAGAPGGGHVGVEPCPASGYLLDASGAVHPVGGAPPVSTTAYWPGLDVARDVSFAGSTGRGYVLDNFGAVHPFGGAAPAPASGYWPGWDIARAVATTPDGKGAYVLEGWGGIHHAGTAEPVAPSGYWHGWDVARDIQLEPGARNRGYVLSSYGTLHPFGDMPPARTTWSQPGGAASFVLLPNRRGGWVVDVFGGVHPFSVGDGPAPAPPNAGVPVAFPTVRGALTTANGTSIVTAGGAVVGNACATPAPWGRADTVRAVVPR